MRRLTDEERVLLEQRKERFSKVLEERRPVLTDFMQRLGFEDGHIVHSQAERFLDPLDSWMKQQTITLEDRNWILTRMAYFIGEFLVQRFSGCWYVNELPDSRFFARYVVGRFVRVSNPNAMVDPFHSAELFVSEAPGRNLKSLLAEIENELQQSQ